MGVIVSVNNETNFELGLVIDGTPQLPVVAYPANAVTSLTPPYNVPQEQNVICKVIAAINDSGTSGSSGIFAASATLGRQVNTSYSLQMSANVNYNNNSPWTLYYKFVPAGGDPNENAVNVIFSMQALAPSGMPGAPGANKKKKLATWEWILIGVGGFFFLVIVIAIIAKLAK